MQPGIELEKSALRQDHVLRACLIRSRNDLATLHLKGSDNVLGRNCPIGCRRALIDDVDPPVAKTFCLGLTTGLVRTMPGDDGMHELNEHSIPSKNLRSDRLFRS